MHVCFANIWLCYHSLLCLLGLHSHLSIHTHTHLYLSVTFIHITLTFTSTLTITSHTHTHTQWPQFFSDLLQRVHSGSIWTVDLFLRILVAIDGEVVDRQVIHTHEVGKHSVCVSE